jgi:glutamate 5-kinase
MVASKIDADLLIILSDIDGLFDRNPKTHSDARLLSLVEKITPEIESYGGDSTSFKGVGGMRTKIKAAKICSMAGCYMLIANSEIKNVVLKILSGEEIGNFFLAERGIRKNCSLWVILSRASGTVRVDAGAKTAVLGKRSLLPAGIIEVEGVFDRGDVVKLECEGRVFAKGITDYTSEELLKIKGAHTNEIEGILGYKNYDNVIKKENIGILEELN